MLSVLPFPHLSYTRISISIHPIPSSLHLLFLPYLSFPILSTLMTFHFYSPISPLSPIPEFPLPSPISKPYGYIFLLIHLFLSYHVPSSGPSISIHPFPLFSHRRTSTFIPPFPISLHSLFLSPIHPFLSSPRSRPSISIHLYPLLSYSCLSTAIFSIFSYPSLSIL